jgi:hypothetical protein
MTGPIKVKPLDNYQLWIKYSDSIDGMVVLSDFVGKGVFSLWNDYREFLKVHIGANGEKNPTIKLFSESAPIGSMNTVCFRLLVMF